MYRRINRSIADKLTILHVLYYKEKIDVNVSLIINKSSLSALIPYNTLSCNRLFVCLRKCVHSTNDLTSTMHMYLNYLVLKIFGFIYINYILHYSIIR